MKNNINKNAENPVFSAQILLEEEPMELLLKINNGELSRLQAWQILMLIHQGEFNCNLPQYGILTVFSLAKDMKQFEQLFDQGCDMLRDNNILTQDVEEQTMMKITQLLMKDSKFSVDTPKLKSKKFKSNKNKNKKN
jgi:hypothetical protein